MYKIICEIAMGEGVYWPRNVNVGIQKSVYQIKTPLFYCKLLVGFFFENLFVPSLYSW